MFQEYFVRTFGIRGCILLYRVEISLDNDAMLGKVSNSPNFLR